ncbi:MAG: twin-arginine translocase TatA/TatE family subunit [ANME-2 cluster archaeon]|nr:twin-arginine translocase TatA/TatE family subunit [ANME-2 cluster archaeon]
MLGSTELLLIFAAALLLFGPDKLPEIAHSLGRLMGDFRKAMREAENQLSVSEVKESIEETITMAKID